MRQLSLLFTLLLLCCLNDEVFAESWKGIIPLHSTRADVEKILRVKSSGKGVDEYEVDMETVQIRYTTEPCPPGGGGEWDAPVGTVTSIWVFPHNDVLFGELGFDTRRFRILGTDVKGEKIYTDDKNGVVIDVNESNGKVLYFYYYERDDDRQMRCRA